MRMVRLCASLLLALIVACSLAVFVSSQSSVQVGYSIITPNAGDRVPVAAALFSYTDATNTLIWEAVVGAT
jgi:hypothetical protein